jgi:phage shock protein PspC (stress-responsive transcriptional regulator)
MSTAATAQQNISVQIANPEPALPLRSDTFLGVCEAVGQDLGFHPNWLRIPFAAMILWNPPVIIASYLALGCVVAVTRRAFPDRAAAQPKPAAAPADESAVVVEKAEEKELLAA